MLKSTPKPRAGLAVITGKSAGSMKRITDLKNHIQGKFPSAQQ